MLSSPTGSALPAAARTTPGALAELPAHPPLPTRPVPAPDHPPRRPPELHVVGSAAALSTTAPSATASSPRLPAAVATLTRLDPRQAADDARLAARWQALHAQSASASFFISWHWISLWLRELPATSQPWLIEVRQPGDDQAAAPIGLAILVRRRRGPGSSGGSPSRLARIPFCEAWHLHAGGDSQWDSNLCIEHNDVLALAGHEAQVRAAVLAAWRDIAGRAAELHLPGIDASAWPAELSAGLHIEQETKLAGGVQLEPVRAAKLDFTPLLSSHSRRFVRRSLKEYQAVLGPTGVQQASSVEQALEFFAALVHLHEATWQRRGLNGAFADPAIRRFHEQLIRRAQPGGEVQLLKIHAGDHAIGYLYSFITRGQVYVYQSGFDYGLLEKHGKPGLVSHTLAIQHNAALGHHYYDLLAGESQYKNSVSTDQRPMHWAIWRKPALRLRLESWAREQLRARREVKAGKSEAAIPAGETTAAED